MVCEEWRKFWQRIYKVFILRSEFARETFCPCGEISLICIHVLYIKIPISVNELYKN